MEVEIQNTKADYLRFFNFYYFTHLKEKFAIIVAISLIFTYNMNVGRNQRVNWWNFTTTELVFLLLLYLLPLIIYNIRLNKVTSNGFSPLEKKVITLTEFGIKIISLTTIATLKWENITSVEKSRDFIYFKLAGKTFGLIPIRFFSSENNAELFYNYIQSKILTQLRLDKPKNGKHLYWWGLIGLIPNFGVISGIILLSKGLFKYKDKILVAIGVASILFTYIFWAYISPLLSSSHVLHK